MVRGIVAQFKGLRPPVRSLVQLFWIYSLTTSLTSVFIQIFLYQQFSSFFLNVAATAIFNSGIFITFCVFGFVASRMRFNIKYGFFWSFIFMGVTLVVLLNSSMPLLAYVAMFLNGLGNGLFWLTIHTFELSETKDEERDFYSSLLTTGTVIFSVVGPALATGLLFVSGTLLHRGDFTLLFLLTPLVYLLGFFCFSNLNEYRPAPIEWKDVIYFITERKNRATQPYLAGTALQETFTTIILPLVVLFVLGGAIQVGLYATGFAFFAALFVLLFSQYRTTQNRLRILGFSTLLLSLATALFATHISLITLMAYGCVGAVLWPMVRVSIHVTDLHTMESIGRRGRDFYATMIFRDASMWLWRMTGACLLLGAAVLFLQQREVLSVGLLLYAASLVVVFLGARLLLKAMGR
ncbi:MAG: MFS transporter [Minisyncoccia bacterium]|jgi:MFS family permease